MGYGSRTKERSTTSGTETVTPQYQDYAKKIMGQYWQPAMAAYQQAMQNYLSPQGMSDLQKMVWGKVGQTAQGFGPGGPGGWAAQNIAPYMGEGYMKTVDPYFQAQKELTQGAVPGENEAFWQDIKRQMGPLWGRSGRAGDEVAEAYGKLRLAQAQKMADIYGAQGAAAQAGMQYTAGVAPTYAQLANPFAWGQQAIQWAGLPEQQAMQEQAAWQQMAQPWSQQLLGAAGMGYQYPVQSTTAGQQVTRGTSTTAGGGMQCCFIMNEAGDLTDTVRWARDARYGSGESYVKRGYKLMAQWLVPMMREYPIVRFFVKCTMTWPIRKVAEKRIIGRHHPALYPLGFFWEAVWSLYGRISCMTSRQR